MDQCIPSKELKLNGFVSSFNSASDPAAAPGSTEETNKAHLNDPISRLNTGSHCSSIYNTKHRSCVCELVITED